MLFGPLSSYILEAREIKPHSQKPQQANSTKNQREGRIKPGRDVHRLERRASVGAWLGCRAGRGSWRRRKRLCTCFCPPRPASLKNLTSSSSPLLIRIRRLQFLVENPRLVPPSYNFCRLILQCKDELFVCIV